MKFAFRDVRSKPRRHHFAPFRWRRILEIDSMLGQELLDRRLNDHGADQDFAMSGHHGFERCRVGHTGHLVLIAADEEELGSGVEVSWSERKVSRTENCAHAYRPQNRFSTIVRDVQQPHQTMYELGRRRIVRRFRHQVQFRVFGCCGHVMRCVRQAKADIVSVWCRSARGSPG